MKVLDWTETFGIYSKLILASVVPSIVPICKNLATQKSFTYVIYIVYILYAYYISYIFHIYVESKVSGI